jgi:hypothetical protein
LPRRERREGRTDRRTHVDLKPAGLAGERGCAEIKLHRKSAVHDRQTAREERRTDLNSAAGGVVKAETEIADTGDRSGGVAKLALVRESGGDGLGDGGGNAGGQCEQRKDGTNRHETAPIDEAWLRGAGVPLSGSPSLPPERQYPKGDATKGPPRTLELRY